MITTSFKCPKCGQESTAIAIDSATLLLCTNRKMRRAYVPILEAKTHIKWYRCPCCNLQVASNQWIKI